MSRQDEGPEHTPPLGAPVAAILVAWTALLTILHLAVREFGIALVP